jgi:hypothetical protein
VEDDKSPRAEFESALLAWFGLCELHRPGHATVVRLAKRHGVVLRQSYARVGKIALIKQADLSPNSHPVMSRVPVRFAVRPIFGSPEGRVFRLFHVGGLAAPS